MIVIKSQHVKIDAVWDSVDSLKQVRGDNFNLLLEYYIMYLESKVPGVFISMSMRLGYNNDGELISGS